MTVSSNKLTYTYQAFRWTRLKETPMKMTSQKQHLPSFATTISALGILLYCIGFLRVELELNNQKKRLNALENNPKTKPRYMYLCSVRWEVCVRMEVTYCVPHSGVFITLIVGLCLNRFTTCCALTLGHFSGYNRPSLNFLLAYHVW